MLRLFIIGILVLVVWLALNAQAKKQKSAAARPPPRAPHYEDERFARTQHIRLNFSRRRPAVGHRPSRRSPKICPFKPSTPLASVAWEQEIAMVPTLT